MWLDGEQEGKTEVLEKVTVINYVQEEVDTYNQEMLMRLAVCDFFLKNEGICQNYMKATNFSYDERSSPTYAFVNQLRDSDIKFIKSLHTAITTFQNTLLQIK